MSQKKPQKKVRSSVHSLVNHRFFYHGIASMVLVLMQVSLYMFVTQPAIDSYFSASVLQSEQDQGGEDVQDIVKNAVLQRDLEFQGELAGLKEQLENYRGQVSDLEGRVDEKPRIIRAEPQVIIKKEVVYIQAEEPTVSEMPSGNTVEVPLRAQRKSARKNGGQIEVKDSSCSSGRAWQDARMQKICID